MAGQLLAAEQYGLGFDFLEKYRKEVAAVTPADVQAVAKKYLDPKTLAIVAVGPIDKDGKPLKEEVNVTGQWSVAADAPRPLAPPTTTDH